MIMYTCKNLQRWYTSCIPTTRSIGDEYFKIEKYRPQRARGHWPTFDVSRTEQGWQSIDLSVITMSVVRFIEISTY